jgi:hypothetical protein
MNHKTCGDRGDRGMSVGMGLIIRGIVGFGTGFVHVEGERPNLRERLFVKR